MKKKLVASASSTIVVILIILWLVGLLTPPIETTIFEIVSDPEAWVDKRVTVDGTIIGPLISIPEVIPPYNYWLQDEDNRTIIVGVKHSGETPDQYVTIIGTVRAGYTEGTMGGDLVFYIEAEKIGISESD